ncbi:PKD domain-containing protein [Flavobacterium azooxidireducens]|uniref:PKD domain-containing protein n=1 Tax=Flavobacterium azooxidireducens TaxID=1871076 RepID=A0ABY4KBY7_9FLAO|nr:PKD domain-containing protein [Flavobacterium azooxidireducens]UPQ78294.1 PKD domain-containing protein [Flavobacterium azooxidireducens]
MKNNNTIRYLSFHKGLFLFLFVLLSCSTTLFAQQSGIILYWDSQVGCLNYEEDRVKEVFIEAIGEGNCAKTCENSVVNYYLQGDTIAQVDWNVSGGSINAISGDQLQATINWGTFGSGFVSFTITLTDQTVIQKVFCIDIIKGPVADFAIAGIDGNKFCAEVPLYFINNSHPDGGTQLVSYFWDFGDDTYSSEFEPSHTYMNSGSYNVTLVVRNECNCIAKYGFKIDIDRPTLPISCPTVVCEGAIEIYTVEGAECEIEWKVEGGNIVSNPNSTSVQVIWDDVDEEGFGYLSALNRCECPLWTTVKIPVIKQKGTILGETELCTPQQYRYKLPQWPGTFYEWTVTNLAGTPSTTNVIQTDQLNEAVLSALQSGTYLLKCVYQNELTGCGGVATLKLIINDSQDIAGDFVLCQGSVGNYSTNYSNTTWQLSSNGTVLSTGSGSNFSYSFTQAGTFMLSASSPDSCNDNSVAISVLETGSLTNSISGDALVCKGLPYTYTMASVGSAYTLVWSTTGGSIQGPNTGDSVVLVFDDPVPSSGYYEVIVEMQRNEFPFCTTEPITLQVYPKEADIEIENIDNLSTFCPSSFTSFTFDFDYMTEVEDITWRIESVTGNTNFGNIIGGQGTDTLSVSWNEISETNLGKVYLDIRFCGKIETFEFDVTLVSTPTLTWNVLQTVICAGEFNPFFLEVESDITINSGTIIWDLGNGSTYSQNITAPGTIFASGMLNFQNIYDTNILQTITATIVSPNGCDVSSTLTGEVTVLPSPRITITPGFNYAVCPDSGGNFSVDLTANVQGGLTLVGAPEWYKENGTTPIYIGNGIDITITNLHGFGNYYALATADNGCVGKSRIISIFESCPQGSCALTFNPSVSVAVSNQSTCYSFQLTGSYTHSPATISWYFPPTTGMTLTSSTNTTANFDVVYPGNYIVFYKVYYLNGEGQLCLREDSVEITVPYIADIRYQLSCLGQGAYDLTLLDNSTHILTDSELDDLVYTFYINGNVQQSGNDPYFNTTSLTAGTYTLGLQLSHPDYPNITSCMAETPLTLYPDPDTNFTISHSPNCTEQVVLLTLNTPITAPGYRYEWQFDGTGFIIQSPLTNLPTIINLKERNEQVPVKLIITDPNGCVFENTVLTVDLVSMADYLGGEIDGGGTFCSGETVSLVYFNSESTPFSYQWMQGNQLIAGATSATYSPTQSGSYWVMLYNNVGCSDRRTPSATVTFYPTPNVSINGPDAVCANTDFVLTATVSGGGSLEKRWLRNGVEIQGWAVATPTTLNLTESVAGVYTYRIEVRDALTGTCSSWAEFEVTVLEAAELHVWYDLYNCNPYQVKLSASASVSGGTFLWSNGEDGESIQVNTGGAYSVTYIAGNGCAVTQQLFVPKDPAIYLWLFPSGCVELCKEELATKILLPAPNAQFNHYSWDVNNVPDLFGSGFSPVYQLGGGGSLDLTLENELCAVTSNPLVITELSCRKCDPKVDVKQVKIYTEPYTFYELEASFENSFGSDVIIEISSPQSYGVFVPSSVYIPNGLIYNFNPLTFIPSNGFSGGTILIRFLIKDKNGKVICFTDKEIELPNAKRIASKPDSLKVVPNPSVSVTSFDYDLGASQNGQLRVYDMLGIQRGSFDLKESKGSLPFDASALPSGNYVVVLFAEGKAIQQQVLIKK